MHGLSEVSRQRRVDSKLNRVTWSTQSCHTLHESEQRICPSQLEVHLACSTLRCKQTRALSSSPRADIFTFARLRCSSSRRTAVQRAVGSCWIVSRRSNASWKLKHKRKRRRYGPTFTGSTAWLPMHRLYRYRRSSNATSDNLNVPSTSASNVCPYEAPQVAIRALSKDHVEDLHGGYTGV